MRILIDTRIWALGLKAPFLTPDDAALKYATTAQSFLKRAIRSKNEILISSQLAAEIFHVLAQRGNRMQAPQARRLLQDLFSRRTTIYRPVSRNIFDRCMELSSAGGIHIWDYLVAFPFEDALDRIYTMDPHFHHKDFQTLAQVENPVGPWKTEGQEL